MPDHDKVDYSGLRLPDEFMITVCTDCLRACCWQGTFMCDTVVNANITERSVGFLKTLNESRDGEHWEYWEKDAAAAVWLREHARKLENKL